MTSNPLRLACLSICLQASFAQAQDAAAASRAQRDASNPLRMIIEASKLKPRQKAAEPELAPKAAPEKGGVRPPVAKLASLLAVPASAQAAPPDRANSLAPTAAVEPPRPAVSPPVEPVSPPVEPVPPAAAETAPRGTPVDPPESPATATTTTAPDQTLPLAALAPAALVSLQLANYVEPVLPDRVRRRLQGEAAVVVRFTVNPDGSVADVAVRSSSDRALDLIALDAVSQWRYKPIAAAQPHAVELVFKTAN